MNIFYLKWSFPLPHWLFDNIFYLKMVCRPILFWESGKIMPISSIWKRDFLFLGLWWEPLENNANIFSLKTGFPLFFLACDGNLWKIMPISSIWKRNFRVFSGLVMGTSFENGISVSFWAFLENNASIFYLKTGFPFFWACDGEPLENNANIFYLKTEFPCFFWACDGNLIWKRDFRVFLGFSGK